VDVPAAVRGKARALGAPGQRWLQGLPDLIRALEREWGLTVGAALPGGSAAYVAAVTTADGAAAVLKLHMPGYDDVATEIRVLRIAAGRGYARLLRADEARGVMLLERLGPRLSQLGLPAKSQMAIICATLAHAWIQVPEAATFPSGAEKARWLRAFIADLWDALDRPCSEAVIEQAFAYCVTREAAFDPARSVLVHGDPHSANTLAPITAVNDALTTGFKLVDPDGLFAERAYDLGILMRDWSGELLAGDALRLGRERCAYLSQLTGEDPEAIWQWGCMMRSSILEVLQEDYIRTARAKGVIERLVVARHAMRNALLPVVTVIGLEFAFLIGGLVVTEQVFNLNGIGKLFVQAVARSDFTMIQALVLLVSVFFVLVNFLIDLMYAFLDPRIRYR
jgi:streptomycin 6-kinase